MPRRGGKLNCASNFHDGFSTVGTMAHGYYLSLAVGLAALLGVTSAIAQPFPTKSIRMVVPLPPGTAIDFFARNVGLGLSERFKKQVIVDNRPGAGGLIGSGIVAAAPADGYTLLTIGPPHVIAPLVQAAPPYRALEDFAAVGQIAWVPNVIVVGPGVAVEDVRGLIALAKAKSGELNFASVGLGTVSHLAAELLIRAGGARAVHVPFKQLADINSEMLAGRVHFCVLVAPAALTLLRGDARMRALATTGRKRSATFPDIPTVAEAGLPTAQSETWVGILAPAATPHRIIAQINADIGTFLHLPDTKDKFARQGGELPDDTTPEAFGKLLASEYIRYQILLKETGIKMQ